jgi:hypothetical protein
MNTIITDNSNAENTTYSNVYTLFSNFSISNLTKKSYLYKEIGIKCVVILKRFLDWFFV